MSQKKKKNTQIHEIYIYIYIHIFFANKEKKWEKNGLIRDKV